jgi:hypothetical protein
MCMRLVILIALWLGCLCASQAQAAERVALIIGNGDYQNAPRLPNPVNDAHDLAAAFERLGFSVTLVSDGTFDGMRHAFLDFAPKAQAAEIAVVFFAGHGMEIRDENWLIPVDAELDIEASASHEAVALASIMPIVASARRLGLVILDACRDNPFSKRIQMSQPGRSIPSRGLVSIEPPSSVLVAFAAKHGTTAADGTVRNSPFTTALLHNLELQGLEINYLFRNVHDEVYSATQQRQEPYVYGTLSRDPIYLKAPPDSVPSEVTPRSEAAQAWATIKDTSDPATLNTFIRRFDNTFYSDLARNRLQLLSRAQATPTTQQTGNSPASLGIAGNWSWQSNCGIFGSYDGTLQFTQPASEKLAGVVSGDDGDHPIFDGRVSASSISFRLKVDGGGTQHWIGTLSRQKSGEDLIRGTGTDSRVPIGHCTWKATRS